MEYKVEPGVEMPEGRRRRLLSIDFPFDEMLKVGDSFFVPMVPEDFKPRLGMKTSIVAGRVRKIRAQATSYQRNANPDFKVRIHERLIRLDGECGIRVWRIEPKKTETITTNKTR